MVPTPRTSHFPHISSETASSSESAPLPTPKGTLVPPPPPPKGTGIAPEARMLGSMTDTFGGVDEESEDEVADSWCTRSVFSRMSLVAPSLCSATSAWSRPRSSVASSLQTGTQKPSTAVAHPLLAPLHTFISPIDPSTRFTDLVEIAEGESGSVYAARIPQEPSTLAPPLGTERPIPAGISHVAIKRIVLPPASSSLLSIKIASLLHELTLLKNLEHEHILLLDGVYVHTTVALDTSLWIRMELMERSLADVIALVAEGLALQERMVGRFTSDVLLGLDYLQKQHIAHRDVRSDNLLLNVAGVVKIADFSNAIRVAENAPMVTGAVGVIYWQAPEMRTGPYDALKVDVWSVGATVWELVETVPPFSIPASPSSQTTFLPPNSIHLGSQWPPLSHPGHYSKGFHEFLRLCGMDAAARPCPEELLNTQFIRNACGRAVIRQLLTQCRSMEEALVAQAAQENAVSVES
ncbi:kinase-like domain-containing protein [Pisolithus croceorrhizus]|nr:kinase-like domain-containing protein [Pisolithus croceorrhizus]